MASTLKITKQAEASYLAHLFLFLYFDKTFYHQVPMIVSSFTVPEFW